MKLRTLQSLAVVLSCVGMVMPTAALGAEVPAARPAAGIDVALSNGGLFVGQVVNTQGASQLGTPVALVYQGKVVVKTVTDKNGVFAAKGLRGGQYQVVTAGYTTSVRLWTAHTAPPTARHRAMVVTGSRVVNGQYSQPGGALSWMQAHPLIVAGAVVTAIAVPLAVANNNDSPSS